MSPRACGGHGVRTGPPKFKEKHQKTECLVFGKYKGSGLWCLVFNPHSHHRVARGGGYSWKYIKDQGQGSRIKAQGHCLGTNGHPGRTTDVILRQSKLQSSSSIIDTCHGRIHAPNTRL